MLRICPKCGEEVPEKYNLCPYCGTGISFAEFSDDYETYTGYSD